MGPLSPRSRGGRLLRVVLYGMAVAHLVEALWLRQRRRRLVALPEPDPGGEDPAVAGALRERFDVVAAAGLRVDARTRAGVAREMAAGAEVVDLLPGDLATRPALRLLRRVDPDRLEHDPLYIPGGAHQALARRRSVTERIEDRPDADGRDDPGIDDPGIGDMVRHTMTARRYAPGAAVLRVAPHLRAAPVRPDDRWREMEGLTAFARPYASLSPTLLGAETAHLLAMTAGLAVAPVAAGAALLTWYAQPALVFAGSPARPDGFRPADLARASRLRLPAAWRDNLATARAGYRRTRERAERRAAVPASAATTPPAAVDGLFERRRATCPWCGSRALTGRLEAVDLVQHKPGRFHLDECRDCGHVFQNPMLSGSGLDYYYDQAYDGATDEALDAAFGSMAEVYRARVAALGRWAVPRTWLDVGTGHGHFCLVARQEWPEAVFEGLDLSESVEEAHRRGWVDRAHRGLFPDLADGLPRSYDVVSMHHYLEHTRDPRRELTAAAKVVEPGGHLMVEVPDPESPWARRLGPYWFPWLQPQHLHFVTCDNMVAALHELGFDVLSVQRGEATTGGDLAGPVWLVAQRLARSPHLPWLPPPSVAHRVKRMGVVAAAAPVAAVAHVADQVKDLGLRRPGTTRPGNAYRVVARKV